MPFANIYLRKGTTPQYRRSISEAIHRSMVDVLHIPDDDQFHVIHELSPDNMIYQPVSFGIERGEHFMFIQLFFNQRPDDQKDALYAAIAENLRAHAGVPKEDIAIVVVETGRSNWWVHGRMVNPATGYDTRMDELFTEDTQAS
jgi:phenylpyruvate tautomerase PptA (4-oxalocrotonate tautomerase family)